MKLPVWVFWVGSLVLLVCAVVAWALHSIRDSEWYTVSSHDNGLGMVAEVRSYCDVIDWDVPYVVYVRRVGETDRANDMVFSDRADCRYGPYVTWISPTKLKIKTWPIFVPPPEFEMDQSPTVLPPTVKRTGIGDISIVYAVYTVPKHKRRPRSGGARASRPVDTYNGSPGLLQ